MDKKARMTSIAVALALMLTLVVGWDQGKAAKTRIIVDQLGREVKIPKK